MVGGKQLINTSKPTGKFRKGKSCSDNLVNLILKVEEAFIEKKEVLAVFLDVQSTFDNGNSGTLISKLAALGYPKCLLQIVKFLTHERLIFTDSILTERRIVQKGVPKAGVLSLLLYVLYIANITNKNTTQRPASRNSPMMWRSIWSSAPSKEPRAH